MTAQKNTPYKHKKGKHFWRTGLSNVKLGIELFKSLHNISIKSENVKIASVGSCFAEHVGRWLTVNNYTFSRSKLDTERVSSFSFGNIYTPKCFLQWLDYDSKNPHRFDIYHCQKKDIYYDLLRPTINENGFTSKNELIKQREYAKCELYNTVQSCNVLIFTLGLTEAWKDIDNVFYPSCPGVIAGQFDDELYRLYEFHYNGILSDLIEIKAKLKAINPEIKIILTVSPVPLTATATANHILVANQYSKSTLRSVAGYLSDTDDDFQYFPSYEIITVNNENDFRFESNRRTVSMEGVDYVMQHFNQAFTNSSETISHTSYSNTIDETECEEEQLEAIRKVEQNEIAVQPEILTLIGDSHMGKLSTALTHLGISHCGGMIMNGSGFAGKKFFTCADEYIVPLESAESRKLWAPVVKNIKAHQHNGSRQLSIIISNVGLQTHKTIAMFVNFLHNKGITDLINISTQQFVDFFNEKQLEQLSLLLNLKDAGHNVIVISDTPFCQFFEESKSMKDLIYSYYAALDSTLANFDIPFLNVAEIFDNEITEPTNYTSNITFADGKKDWVHGNEQYYNWLAEKLVNEVLLPVMQT